MCVCVQVRLLTGIGRFYEMAYILQLLMENDQFESLLHTGLEKVCMYILLHTSHFYFCMYNDTVDCALEDIYTVEYSSIRGLCGHSMCQCYEAPYDV